MPRYQYLALDVDGRERSGDVDAADERTARAALQKRKLLPVELAVSHGRRVREAEASAPVRARDALSHKQRLVITRQLATLVDASVPVEEALATIAAQQENAAARRIMRDVHQGVLEGMRLGDAMARHPRSFTGLYRAAVTGGERASKLGFTLTRLADYLGRAHALRSKVQAAMIYPAALSFVALTVVCCLMIFVVPSLTEQFQSFDAQLPILTQILIGVSGFLTAYWPLLLLVLAAGGYILHIMFKRESVRLAWDGALLKAPLIGRWTTAVAASRFVRGVSTLVASGLPVLDSVRAAREGVGNLVTARAAGVMAERIEQGEPLSHAMRRSGVIPPLVCYMAQSGENAGDLPGMLDKAAEHLEQEVESFAASAISLLEPAIIVFMGIVVASIVLAIMLPILQLNRLAIG